MKYLIAVFLFSSIAHAFNYAEPSVKWSKKNIKVCFADVDDILKDPDKFPDFPYMSSGVEIYSAKDRKPHQSIIEKEYTPERTGIHFTGWQDCRLTKKPDVYIFRAHIPSRSDYGAATIGERGAVEKIKGLSIYKKDFKKLNSVYFNTANFGLLTLGYADSFQMTALHEFGHVAGLRHEHVGVEAIRLPSLLMDGMGDGNCHNLDLNLGETTQATTKKIGIYDVNSIMNYCHMDTLEKLGLHIQENEFGKLQFNTYMDFRDKSLFPRDVYGTYHVRIGLSQGDIKTLKCLYLENSAKNCL